MSIQTINVADIRVSTSTPQKERRKRFNAAALAELAASIKTHGVLQPIIVRPAQARHEHVTTYELVAGERRLLAARTAELAEIPAVVRKLTDEQVLEVQLIENLQREDLHPMQEAEGYQELVSKHGHAVDELNAQVGKSRSYVYGRLKLLALCPEARKAFYDGKISASVALLIARIPAAQLQKGALKDLTVREVMSFREASRIVHDHYMLRLAEATFPTDDAKLNGNAGPCGTCPKRTGNQPELFGDVKSADVCTDPVCFGAKTLAYGQRLIEQARDRGQPVITGNQAKKLAPHGVQSYTRIPGYRRLDESEYVGRDFREQKVSAIVGKDAERTLLQEPKSGRVIELVPDSAVREALGQKATGKTVDPYIARQRSAEKAKAQKNKLLLAIYKAARPKLKTPASRELAHALFARIEYDVIKMLCKVREFEPPIEKLYGRNSPNHYAIGNTIDKLSVDELNLFMHDCMYAREIVFGRTQYSGARGRGIRSIEQVAKSARVDVARICRELTPKKKAKKRKAA